MDESGNSMEKLEFDVAKIKIVDINEVRPNTWNPKDDLTEEFEEVKRSIELNGQDLPVQVRENPGVNPEVDKYEIIDGGQRYKAIKELGWKRIIIYDKGVVGDKEAREKTIAFQTQVPFSQAKLISLLSEMSKSFGKLDLPYSDEKLQEYLKLGDFNFSDITKEPVDIDLKDVASVIIRVTSNQYDVIKEAEEKVKGDTEEMTEGRCLELICIDFINSPKGTTGAD